MSKYILMIVCVITLLGLAACNKTPHPTTRRVSNADIVGTWFLSSDILSKSESIIIFKSNGTFDQVTTTIGTKRISRNAGTWNLDTGTTAYILMKNLEVYDMGHWKTVTTVWFAVDSAARPSNIGIAGSLINDPDAFVELTPK